MTHSLTFVAMWTLMMVAMMLPSLIPVLRRYPNAVALAAGYFLVWAAFGAAAYVGSALLIPLTHHVVPLWTGALLLALGLVQFTGWKLRHLFCCRDFAPNSSGIGGVAWDGMRLGWHCCRCCTALMALLFVLGMMRPAAIVLVAVLIAAERLAARPVPVVRAVGVLILTIGAVLILRR